MSRIYGPIAPKLPQGSPVVIDYDIMKQNSGQVRYLKIKLALNVALDLTSKSPYPASVKVGVMKQVSAAKGVITLQQLSIFLGWAADRAMR
jgi:hypothetical protein